MTGACLHLALLLGTALLALAPAAAAQAPRASLDEYRLEAGAALRHALPPALDEASGLAVSAQGRVFTHGDELAVISELDPRTGRVVKSFRLGRTPLRGDFEGIAIAGERFFLVTSDGTLYEFREAEAGAHVFYRRTATGLGRRCEVEGLAYDAHARALLLACKTTTGGALRERVVVFSFDLERMQLDPEPRLSIPFRALVPLGLRQGFHSSSLEVHPSGTLYLISAQQEAIIEVHRDGRVLAVRKLDRRVHPQAEGISFLPDGSLLLVDEAQEGRAVLSVYPAPRAVRQPRRRQLRANGTPSQPSGN